MFSVRFLHAGPLIAMRVLALTRYSATGASSRVRTFQFLKGLQAYGIDATVSSLLDDAYLRRLYARQSVSYAYLAQRYARRILGVLQAKHYDLVCCLLYTSPSPRD